MKKYTHPLMRLLVLAAMMLAMLLVTSVLMAGAMMAGADIMSGSGMKIMQLVTQLLTFAVPMALFVYIYYRDEVVGYLKLRCNRRRWGLAATGVVVMALLVPLTDWLTIWNDGWQLGPLGDELRNMQNSTEAVLEDFMVADTVGGLLANLVVVALVPAVCEELVFRAGVQNQLHSWMRNPHAAVWITAVIFSLMHGEIFSFMPRLLLGAALGYLYIYGGSLTINMVAHFFNNALVVVLYWLSQRGVVGFEPDEPLALGWTIVVGCTLAAIMLFYVSFVYPKRAKN